MVKAQLELFVESSALVAWSLWEQRGPAVLAILRRARVIWLSALANAECARALQRASADARVTAAYVRSTRKRLASFVSGCRVIPVDEEILERVGGNFPLEPLRTLDAIHLASLERVRVASPRAALVSLDDRVRDNAKMMGVVVLP